MLSFVTPLMLGGLLLVGLPILAHLLHRHARRKVVFPTIRLLTLSAASQSQLFKVRRWILLALRTLMVAMVVAAFARPLWLDTRSAAGDSSRATAVVLLIDASASTAQQAEGVSTVEAIRAAAGRALDGLASGTDLANAVYATAQPYATFPRLSPNLPATREELGRFAPSFERADLPKAIALAGEMLSKHNGPRRLVVLTDFQQSNWQDIAEHANLAELLPQNTQVTLVELPEPALENIALSSPRVFPPQPLAKQTSQWIVHVRNFAARVKQVKLEAYHDELPIADQTVTLAPGEARDVVFEGVVPAAGEHRVEFVAPQDGLAADNRAFLVVKSAERLPVVIASDDDPNEPGSGAYFLARALAPHKDQEIADRYEVRHVAGRALATAGISDAAAVLVGYLGELPDEAAKALEKYVAGGGGLVWFCGEGSVERQLQALDKLGEAGLLPWPPGPARSLSPRDEALHITAGRWQSRLLREFDEQSQLAIAQISFKRAWATGAPRSNAQVLLTFSDGTPALGSRAVGSGQVLVANFSPSLETSDLGKYGAFVALVQALAKGLRATTDATATAVVGAPYRYPHNIAVTGGGLEALGPDNKSVTISTSLQEDKLSVHFAYPRLPGFYRIEQKKKFVGTAALNLDPRESDPRRIEREALMARFQKSGVSLDTTGVSGFEPMLNLHGRPLWGWCLALAMLFAGLELACLIWWRR